MEWNLQRTISKINYRIHTDSIKENLIPANPTHHQTMIIYAKLMVNHTDLSEKIPSSCYAIYIKMMYALKKKLPEIDLSTLTKAEILGNGYPVRTDVEAMNAGLLLDIPEASMLDHMV